MVKSAPTFPERVASVDIGTNTILLLIAGVKEGILEPLLEKETVVRLGQGLKENGLISKEAMQRALRTLNAYLTHCRAMDVRKVFAVGTSALREAKNTEVFLKQVRETLHLSVEVISGEEEARLSYLAVERDLRESNTPILVIDVGGGSTEFILGQAERVTQWISLPLGLVHLTEQFLVSDPVQDEEWEKMAQTIRKTLSEVPHPEQPFLMVSVGGTGTTLASVEQGLAEFTPEKIHHFILSEEALKNQLLLYRSKPLYERIKLPGLPAAQADVILAGGSILHLAMEKLQAPSILISCHGVRYGLIYKKLQIANCKLKIEKSKTT